MQKSKKPAASPNVPFKFKTREKNETEALSATSVKKSGESKTFPFRIKPKGNKNFPFTKNPLSFLSTLTTNTHKKENKNAKQKGRR